MGWLLGKVTGNPMLLLWIALGAFAAGAVSGGGTAWKVQGWRLDAVQSKYDGFVGEVKAAGDAAEIAKNKQEASDKQAKKDSDDEHERAINILASTVVQLRNERASSSFVPGAASVTSSPDRACFDRASLESSIRDLDKGVQGFVDKGSKAVIDLNTAKLWAVRTHPVSAGGTK